jgi:hypothetical protein
MSSPAQIIANQANAQLSTGPRTDAGKARSSQNALSHGLTAKVPLIRPEDQDEFAKMHAALLHEIDPQGALQLILFQELVGAAWNLRRVSVLERELDLLDENYDRLARHKVRFERTFHRCHKELKTLKTDAALRLMLPHAVAVAIPQLASIEQVAKRSQQVLGNLVRCVADPQDIARLVGHAPRKPKPASPNGPVSYSAA